MGSGKQPVSMQMRLNFMFLTPLQKSCIWNLSLRADQRVVGPTLEAALLYVCGISTFILCLASPACRGAVHSTRLH